MDQLRADLLKILLNYGVKVDFDESFLTSQLPILLTESLRETNHLSKSVSMVCEITDSVFAHSDYVAADVLTNLIHNLMAAPVAEIEKLLTFESWLMTLFEKQPELCAADATLRNLFERVFVDPWSQERLKKSALWSKRYAESTARFHGRIEVWLSKKYGLGANDENRFDQGGSLALWTKDLFSEAKMKRSHPAALAAITLLSLGTDSMNDYMNAGEPYSAKFTFQKKSWNYEFGQRALEDLGKTFDGGSAVVKKLTGADEFNQALATLWSMSKPHEAKVEELQAFTFLKMAFGECCYEPLSIWKRRFPGSYF